MRETIQQYLRGCDPCQRRKENREIIAPLGDVHEPKIRFEVTSLDITGPYPKTPQGNKYLLTLIDHLTKYAEAFPFPDHTAEACARVYSSQIVTRHGSGSTLSTDQGREFMSSFFQRTCKILGVRRMRTSSYDTSSNGMVEGLHRFLYSGLSHYVNANHKNWDEFLSLYLMSRRATPHTTTGYSPFYLLHERDMVLPSTDNLKARLPKDNTDEDQRLENLKSNLRLAYKLTAKANRKSHLNNKRLYDRNAKPQDFEVQDLVYLYNPALKPGLTRKFAKLWIGTCQITKKIFELNYEIVDLKGKRQLVHVNRLKKPFNPELWKPKPRQRPEMNCAQEISKTSERKRKFTV